MANAGEVEHDTGHFLGSEMSSDVHDAFFALMYSCLGPLQSENHVYLTSESSLYQRCTPYQFVLKNICTKRDGQSAGRE